MPYGVYAGRDLVQAEFYGRELQMGMGGRNRVVNQQRRGSW